VADTTTEHGLTRGTVAEGTMLWEPDDARVAATNLRAYERWLADHRGLRFDDYGQLWRWSVTDLEGFWGSLWEYFDVDASVPPARVLGRRTMPGAEWFPGARLNYAEHVLRRAAAGGPALWYLADDTDAAALGWEELGDQVRAVATALRELGVRPGERVVAYLPNVPETIVAMLATTAIGAVWASCSPDFGWKGASERFAQLEPTVLFTVDGYRYGGRDFDRRDEVRHLVAELGALEHVVHVPTLTDDLQVPGALLHRFHELATGRTVPSEDFAFEQLPFDAPLWVLFSSGTTGLPKALVHGHGGILIEQLKLQTFHMDLRPGDRLFFFTTTGWMMWNFIASSLLLGVQPVLYDGDPGYPGPDRLWRTAQDLGVSFFGTSPSFIENVAKTGLTPKTAFDLSALRTVMPAGSPVYPEITAWFYDRVGDDLWVATGSGGTDCCTGFVGGVPTLPVRAGEIQAPSLGVAVAAFDEEGSPVVDEVGELVITEPMPSMPVRLWGDRDHARYRETYFDRYPGVWRHGDFFRINQRGGCFVLGRSDATLNRHGVRIGTAEVYRALQTVDELGDALIVNIELPGGGFHMPLFVTLRGDAVLDDGLRVRIRDVLRREYTARHVPDAIVEVPAIPRTVTGKKMEVPVRKLLLGFPAEQAVNLATMEDPTAIEPFRDYAASLRAAVTS
jgi:acetoacetyl-CoA synthetase